MQRLLRAQHLQFLLQSRIVLFAAGQVRAQGRLLGLEAGDLFAIRGGVFRFCQEYAFLLGIPNGEGFPGFTAGPAKALGPVR
ncbi:MAG: hypothetical protein LC123_05600 [Burkholderiales bacterium]|nr:hypothetical protein [Burkholderiales bacterium]